MTLNEAIPLDPLPEFPSVDSAPADEQLDLLEQLREAVSTVLVIEREEGVSYRGNFGIMFAGVLQHDPDEAYRRLEGVLTPLGFTAFLQRKGGTDVVLAMQGLLRSPESSDKQANNGRLRRVLNLAGRSPLWLHGALLLATAASVIFAGSLLLGADMSSLGDIVATGTPFALALLFILGVHEMGHYLAARYHQVNVTLPFFVPLPIPGSLGTLGAVIFIRSALKTRRSLFDVGISGPLAGMVVALPIFVIGLLLPPIEFGAPINLIFQRVGVPVLLQAIGGLVVDGNISQAILVHPVALAAWFGVLLTALNLLPMGQFDGGHIAYALVGRYAWVLAFAVFGLLIVAGILLWPTWLVWAVLAVMTGLRHPPPHNDITPLDLKRRILGGLTILLFLLIIVPQPITTRQTFSLNSNTPPLPTIAVPDIPTPVPFDLGASSAPES
ncbi:site-2 protease family protein [Chloroflexota bacterium]